DPAQINNVHSKLLYFLGVSKWDDRAVRLEAARYALDAMQRQSAVVHWIVDDTDFLKQGSHSVGVQRQYTGSAGKIANCQLGVSLSVATRSAHVPIDFELYLPKTWTSSPALRKECHIPEQVEFKTKEDLALMMLARAIEDGIPGHIVLGDSWYGRSSRFRNAIRAHGLDFAVGIHPTQKM